MFYGRQAEFAAAVSLVALLALTVTPPWAVSNST